MEKKEQYVSPRIEVIEMENEGVIALSNGLPGIGDDGGITSNSRSYNPGFNDVTASELEDMITDIMTYEQ